jgi:hypothetical protein
MSFFYMIQTPIYFKFIIFSLITIRCDHLILFDYGTPVVPKCHNEIEKKEIIQLQIISNLYSYMQWSVWAEM